MKHLAFGTILLLAFVKVDAQPVEKIPIENSLMKAIDWYIDSTTKYLNEIANKNNRITNNGIVAIEFVCQSDTIRVVRDNENRVIKVSYPRRFIFRIDMVSENLAKSPLPSYYFIRGKTPIIIYSGIETFTKQNEGELKNYKKNVLDRAKDFRLVSSIKTYLIEINDLNPDEFKMKEIPNTVSRYID